MEIPQNTPHPYQITKLLGQGQFGRVFQAIDPDRGTLVALKEIEYHKFPTHKFLREVRFLVTLQHPNIVSCQGLKHNEHARYIVMDYCNGGSLRELIEQNNQIDLKQALEIIIDVLVGLEYAHSKGIIHCDLKPENILLDGDRTRLKAMISDFGIAKLADEERSELMGVTGSPAYMAPERFYGKYFPSSDLYAVGVMLFEMITGDRPFSGLPGKLMVAHLNEQVEFPPTVPFLVRKVITKALQKLPQKRFHSAGEMLADIRVAAEAEKSAHPSPPSSIDRKLDNLF